MNYLTLFLSFSAVAVALTLAGKNIMKRKIFSLNGLFAALCIISALAFIFTIFEIIDFQYISLKATRESAAALFSALPVIFFILLFFYPGRFSGMRVLSVCALSLPGFIVSLPASVSDQAAALLPHHAYILFKKAQHPAVLVCAAAYLLGPVILVLARSFFFENASLKKEMVYFSLGMIVPACAFLVPAYAVPVRMAEYTYRTTALCLSWPFILLLAHHAVSEPSEINFKGFYARFFFWILIFTALCVPSLFVISLWREYRNEVYMPSLFVTIVLFLYLFISFRFFSTWRERALGRNFSKIVRMFDNLLMPLNNLDDSEELFWDNLYHGTISGMAERFGMRCCYFFLFDFRAERFDCVYRITGGGEITKMLPDDLLVRILYLRPRSLARFQCYTDGLLLHCRADLVKFFNAHDLAAAIPFFNTNKQMGAILLLGNRQSGKEYPARFVSGLELFRIQLQQQIERRLILEEVKKKQIVEHDRMVVHEIKNRIMPKKLRMIQGIRSSSFNIRNSDQGGDYFDSVPVGRDRIAFFMADASYHGVDSAVASLLFFSVLHSLPAGFDAPGKVLSIMNRILLQSRFTDRYAPAACVFVSSDRRVQYSNAACNPPAVYFPSRNSFVECGRQKGVPVGVDPKCLYDTGEIAAEAGSIGVMYSGGFISSINDKGEEYTFERAGNIIKNSREDSPAVLVRKLYRDFTGFLGGRKQINDVSLIIFKV